MGSSVKTLVTDSSATATESDGSATETDSDIHNLNDTVLRLRPDSTLFSEGQKVLASHGDLYYAAKVIRIAGEMNERKFFVHYLGWKKSWDEWVGTDRLMEYTEENVQRHRTVLKKHEIDKSLQIACSSHLKPRSTNVVKGKKRKNVSVTKDKGAIPMGKLVNIQIPPRLKKQLFDDCEFVTHMGKVVKLPRIPNVRDIFDKYLEYREKKDDFLADSVREIMKGLQTCFDKALPMILLYKSERRQFEEVIADDVPPSTVYGAEHLLRLFVKLPELLSGAIIEEETLMELQLKLVDFLKFLRKNQKIFFLSAYHVAEDIETSTNKRD